MKCFAPLLLVVTGCYLSHELGGADASVPRDASVDAGRDASPPRDGSADAHVARCDTITAGPTVLIDHDGVTPRLVALEGGEVGLAYVDPGSGDPTSVYYERLGADLSRLTGPVLVTRTSWTWAEPARHGDGVVLAFGNAVDEGGGSTLLPLDANGAAAGPAVHVDAMHPDILRAFDAQLLWVAFESHDVNQLALAHVRPGDGSLVHDVMRVPMGRYGGQHAVAELPGGAGHLVAYASEGPPGVRRPRVTTIAPDGTVAPERALSDSEGADAVAPVVVGSDAYVLWRNDVDIALTRVDPTTLATLDERRLPRVDGALFAANLEGHWITVGVDEPALVSVSLAPDGITRRVIEVPLPRATWSGAASMVAVPGALVVAAGLTDGPHALPWVLRLECAER